MRLDRTRHLLFVEGDDDLFVLANLLENHIPGLVLDKAFVSTRSVDRAIRSFRDALANQKLERVGLVVDANGDPGRRRDQIRRELEREALSVGGGLTLFEPFGGCRAGVWLMPDNTSPGALEDFLLPMLGSTPLTAWAREASRIAKDEKSATFPDENKACVRAWLAWQHQPGLPPGEAVKRGLLDTSKGGDFVAWFTALFSSGQEPAALDQRP